MGEALKTYYEDKAALYTVLVSDAKSQLLEATDALNLAKFGKHDDEDDIDGREDIVAQISELESDISKLRQDLSQSDLMPSEIEAMAVELRDDLMAMRNLNAQLFGFDIEIDEAQGEKEIAEALLNEYESSLSDAESDSTQATTDNESHQQWLSVETEESIDEIKNSAQSLLDAAAAEDEPEGEEDAEEPSAEQIVWAANQRINSDLPETLVEQAQLRANSLVNEELNDIKSYLADLESQLSTFVAAHDGEIGAVQAAEIGYQNAKEALKDAVANTENELNKSLQLLQQITNSVGLSDAEISRIESVALEAEEGEDSPAAVVAETALISAMTAVADKQRELELAIVQAKLNDIDADPDDDATVQTLTGELSTLEGELSDAQSNFTMQNATDLETWEASVPDNIWLNLANYTVAIALLNKIVALDLSSLKTAFTNAETALVTALGDLDKNYRANLMLDENMQAVQRKVDYLSNALTQHQLSALKGEAQ